MTPIHLSRNSDPNAKCLNQVQPTLDESSRQFSIHSSLSEGGQITGTLNGIGHSTQGPLSWGSASRLSARA